MKREIIKILSQDFCCDEADNPVAAWNYGPWEPEEEIVSKDPREASLEDLVSLCDQSAESRNAHDFCGSHRLLAALLFRRYGRTEATAAMLEIAELGGLHGMAGICNHRGETDAYKELGVGESGRDWDGTFGEAN